MNISEFLSGAVGGTACTLAGQPFDTIKTKLQTFPNVYRNVPVGIKKTFLERGILGFYAGSFPATITAAVENAVLFVAYSKNIRLVQDAFAVREACNLRPWHHGCAGSMSGMFTGLVVCSTEMVKCRLQVQKQLQSTGIQRGGVGGAAKLNVRSIVSNIYRQDGMRGYVRGLTATWARDIPGYFSFFTGKFMVEDGLNAANIAISQSLNTIISGGLGGCCYWMMAFLLDVLKSRIQVKASPSSSLFGTFVHVMSTEGPLVLYKGITPALMRSFPANGALWLAYSVSKAHFDSLFS